MKKLSLLLLLMTTVVFFSCEEERLIQEDLNQLEKEQVVDQERTNLVNANRMKSNQNFESINNGAIDLTGATSVPLNIKNNIYSFGIEDILEVYVDYTSISSIYDPFDNDIIAYHENQMSQYYTIYAVEKSNTCDWIYKWYVDKNEYGSILSTTIAEIVHHPKSDSDEENPFDQDPYFNCFP